MSHTQHTYIGADWDALEAEEMRARAERARQIQALISKFQRDADRAQARGSAGKVLKSSIKDLLQCDRGKEGKREWGNIKSSIETMVTDPEIPKKNRERFQKKGAPPTTPAVQAPAAPQGPMGMMEQMFKLYQSMQPGTTSQPRSSKFCTHCNMRGHINETCFKLHPELRK